LVDGGSVTIGDVVRAMSLFSILTLPMEILGYLFQEMPRSVVAMDRIDGVLAEQVEPRPVAPLDSVSVAARPVVVEFDAVGFAHADGLDVLTDLDLRLEPGESVALVGATGSGKSTAVALLAGLVPPTTGEVRVGGETTLTLGPEGVAASVATVLQETFLFADTVRSNLLLGRDVGDDELAAALDAAVATDFVAGLPTTRTLRSSDAWSFSARPCTVKIAPLASRRSWRSIPALRGREPTSRATSAPSKAVPGSSLSTMSVSSGKAQSSSSMATPSSAPMAGGISSICRMIGWSGPSRSPLAIRKTRL
jgi:hypothetical protein